MSTVTGSGHVLLRLPDTGSNTRSKVSRLSYARSGTELLAIGSNYVHKRWILEQDNKPFGKVSEPQLWQPPNLSHPNVCVWSTEGGWEKKNERFIDVIPPEGETMVQSHKDESLLLVIHQTRLSIFNSSLECIRVWSIKEPMPAPISCALYSCDCHFVYTASYDGEIGVFDAQYLTLLCHIPALSYIPSSMSSAEDILTSVIASHTSLSKKIALGTNDGSVLVMDLTLCDFAKIENPVYKPAQKYVCKKCKLEKGISIIEGVDELKNHKGHEIEEGWQIVTHKDFQDDEQNPQSSKWVTSRNPKDPQKNFIVNIDASHKSGRASCGVVLRSSNYSQIIDKFTLDFDLITIKNNHQAELEALYRSIKFCKEKNLRSILFCTDHESIAKKFHKRVKKSETNKWWYTRMDQIQTMITAGDDYVAIHKPREWNRIADYIAKYPCKVGGEYDEEVEKVIHQMEIEDEILTHMLRHPKDKK